MFDSNNSKQYVDWNGFYRRCEEGRDHSDDIYRIALIRVERMFRNHHDCGLDDENVDFERLANIIHGIRIADSHDMGFDAIQKSGIKLTPFEEGALSVLNALDVTMDMRFIVP